MTDSDNCKEDDASSVVAPCNKCAFAYPQRKRVRKRDTVSERDVYRMGSKRPGCAYYVTGVPMGILKGRKKCVRFVEKQEVEK